MAASRLDQKAEDGMKANSRSMMDNFNVYFRWNLSLFPLELRKRILEVGCGPGLYFHEIMQYDPRAYTATDYSPHMVEEVRRLMAGREGFKAVQLDLTAERPGRDLAGAQFDYCLCFDVLEHIEDDRLALLGLRDLMLACRIPRLFLRVPALEFLFGRNDRAIGHQRRYNASGLRRLLHECGFEVHKLRYQNLPGMIPWFMVGRVLRRNLAISENEADLFSRLVPLVRRAENLLPPPLGLSLYGIMSPRP